MIYRCSWIITIMFFPLVVLSSHAQGIPIPNKYILYGTEIQDEKGNPLTEFEPIHLELGATTATFETRSLVARAKLIELPLQPGTFFLCPVRPAAARFQVFYGTGDPLLRDYYLRPENALSEDYLVHDGLATFDSNGVAEIKWDGRDTGSPKRHVVRGNAGSYFVVVSASPCAAPIFGPTVAFTVARPHAILAGYVYPESDYYFDVLERPEAVDHCAAEGGDDFFSGPQSEAYGTELVKRAARLQALLPDANGYDPFVERNLAAEKMLGLWPGAAIFVYAGHSWKNLGLTVYSGPGGANDNPGDIIRFSKVVTLSKRQTSSLIPNLASLRKSSWTSRRPWITPN